LPSGSPVPPPQRNATQRSQRHIDIVRVNPGFSAEEWRGIRVAWGIFPRRETVPAADHEGMETNSTSPQDDARSNESAGNQAGRRTLRRSSQGRILGGVGAGVADYLGTDVTATRVGLAAVAVLGHVAIPVYAAGWALIPEEGKSRSRASEFLDSMAVRVDSVATRVRQSGYATR
jgi:phage shock protein PspC (stress-responsive transcriptional regulator)